MISMLLPAVKQLHKCIPPPLLPKYGGTDVEWSDAELKLGRCLPLDFKQIIQTYGYGQFENEFSFFQPFVGDIEVDGVLACSLIHYNINYKEIVLKTNSSPPTYCSDWLVDITGNKIQNLAIWPSENSVFWLTHHSNGFDIAYRASSVPEKWTILVSIAAHAFFEYPMTLSEFLLSRIVSENDKIVQVFSHKKQTGADPLMFNPMIPNP